MNPHDSGTSSTFDDLGDLDKNPSATILKTLGKHLWPKGDAEIKARIVVSLGALITGKICTVQVPFFFKNIIDSLNTTQVDLMTMGVPLTMVLGYGIARSSALVLQEFRNVVFATVAQNAIRRVSQDIFTHLMFLDLQWHLSRETGAVSRTIDRGGRSINFLLNRYNTTLPCSHAFTNTRERLTYLLNNPL